MHCWHTRASVWIATSFRLRLRAGASPPPETHAGTPREREIERFRERHPDPPPRGMTEPINARAHATQRAAAPRAHPPPLRSVGRQGRFRASPASPGDGSDVSVVSRRFHCVHFQPGSRSPRRRMRLMHTREWGPPERGRSMDTRGGGRRPRPDAEVGRGTADRSVGSDSACAAVKKHHKELTPWVRDPE